MAVIHAAVSTSIKWIDETAATPVIGGFFLFGFIFLPPVLFSFALNSTLPGFSGEEGFTKGMLILLPGWLLCLWLKKIKLFLFLIPGWMLFGGIALYKAVEMFFG